MFSLVYLKAYATQNLPVCSRIGKVHVIKDYAVFLYVHTFRPLPPFRKFGEIPVVAYLIRPCAQGGNRICRGIQYGEQVADRRDDRDEHAVGDAPGSQVERQERNRKRSI